MSSRYGRANQTHPKGSIIRAVKEITYAQCTAWLPWLWAIFTQILAIFIKYLQFLHIKVIVDSYIQNKECVFIITFSPRRCG